MSSSHSMQKRTPTQLPYQPSTFSCVHRNTSNVVFIRDCLRIDLVVTRHLKLIFPSMQTYELPGMIPVNKVELKGHWGYEVVSILDWHFS